MNDPFSQDISDALLSNYKNRTGKVRTRRMKRKLYLLKNRVVWLLGWLQTTFENKTGLAKIKANRFYREVGYGR